LTGKLAENDLVLVCDQGSLVGLCTHDYKCLCAAVTISVTLVNIQTHTDIYTPFLPAYINSSAG